MKRFWMTVVSVALLSVMLCGCSTLGALAGGLVKQETETQMEASAVETASPDPTAEPTATPAPTATPTVEPTPTPTPAPTSAPTATPAPTAEPEDDYYVLPESNVRRIEESELYGLSEWECCIARNEIYARHGRIFRDEEIAAYFASMPWYSPQVEPDVFDATASGRLPEIEMYNVDVIVQYEDRTFGD